MKKLHIAPGFTLPVETVTQSVAILAKRRAGKSYTARRITEELAKAKQQVVIIDPKGDWWGIRSAADGKAPGLPITILGGEHGDIPLEAGAGEIVAKLVVFEAVSILLDVSHFRKKEVAQFMSAFLEAFYRLKAAEEYRSPVMLVVDEADAIAPQKPFAGEERMLGAIEDIVRRGGQRGIGCLLITQRSAVLNKNVLTQSEVLVAMRTIAPQDLDAMNAWIDVHGTAEERKVLMASLPSLPVGDAWFWSPGWPDADGIFRRVHVFPIETFDSGATPKPGEKRIEPKNLADVDLEALRRQMAATIEKAKADDPRELRREIAELKKQLSRPATVAFAGGSGSAVAIQAPKEIAAERLKKEFEKGARAERKRIAGEMGRLLKSTQRRLEDVLPFTIAIDTPVNTTNFILGDEAMHDLHQAIELLARTAPMPEDIPVSARAAAAAAGAGTSRMPQSRSVQPPRAMQSSGDSSVSAPERRILTVLAQRPQGVDLDRLAILAGYTVNGHFTNILGGLRAKSFVTAARVIPIQATEEGITALGDFESLPTGPELQQWWLQRLSSPEQRILKVLLDRYPEPVALDELAQKAGYTVNGHFTNTIGSLRTKGLMTPPREPIRAAEDFFE